MEKASYTVKGTHIMASRTWVDARLGEGTFDKLGEEFEVTWSKILPSGWYDIYSLMRIMEHATKKLGVTIFDACVEIARRNAEEDLKTIYRAFLRLAGAKGLLNATPTLWRNYVAFGTVEKIKNEPGLHIAIGRGIPLPLLEWAGACWHGFIPTAVEVAGGKNPQLEIVESGLDPNAAQPGDCFVKIELRYEP